MVTASCAEPAREKCMSSTFIRTNSPYFIRLPTAGRFTISAKAIPDNSLSGPSVWQKGLHSFPTTGNEPYKADFRSKEKEKYTSPMSSAYVR